MKQISLFILPVLLFAVKESSNNLTILASSNYEEIVVSSLEKNYTYINDTHEIYGNLDSLTKLELDEILKDTSKFYVFYNLNNLYKENQKLDIFKNNCVIYYYKNNVLNTSSLISNGKNNDEIIFDINEFIIENYSKFNKKNIRKATSNSTALFNNLYTGSFRNINKPYGYFDCDYTVLKYRANNVSSLYLINAHAYFTPGYIANRLGDTKYNSDEYNKSGYIKIKPSRAINEVGYNQIRYGGTPVYKDAFPVNNPGTVTITSSYSLGLILGYSLSAGFSLTNIEVGDEQSYETSIGLSYSKAYTNSEPRLSAQKDVSDSMKFSWFYSYATRVGGKETNHLNVGYLFEMNNSNHNLSEGDLAFTIDYQFTTTHSSFSDSKYFNYY